MRKITHLRIEYKSEGAGMSEDDWARVLEFGLMAVRYFDATDGAADPKIERVDEVDMGRLKQEVENLC